MTSKSTSIDDLDTILDEHLEMCLEDGVEMLSKDHYVQLKFRLNELILKARIEALNYVALLPEFQMPPETYMKLQALITELKDKTSDG